MGWFPKKECPYCHMDYFGWWDLLLLTLNYSRECKNCGNLVRNSGRGQFLSIFSPLLLLCCALPLFELVPDWLVISLLIFLLPLSTMFFITPAKVKAGNPQTDLSPFTPDPENDKAILIQGWNEDELRKILDDFVEQDLSNFDAFRIEIQTRFENLFVLTFSEDIHPDEFLFLINYLAYPVDFDLEGRSIVVAGRTTLNSDFDGLPKLFAGKKAILYLPENDEDHDVVFLQSESGLTLAKSFHQGIWHKVKDARLPSAVKSLTW